jgi:hypothetical protein
MPRPGRTVLSAMPCIPLAKIDDPSGGASLRPMREGAGHAPRPLLVEVAQRPWFK